MTPRLNLTLWLQTVQRELRGEPEGARREELVALRRVIVRRLLALDNQ